MKSPPFVLVLASALACSGPAAEPGTVQPAADTAGSAVSGITATDMYARIAFLASDALGGRNTPSHGLEVAAQYIASEFARMGLEPLGDHGTFLQRYPYTQRRLRSENAALHVTVNGQRHALAFGSEMFVAPGAADAVARPLVFVGRHIPATSDLRARVPVVHIAGVMDRTWRAAFQSARTSATAAGAAALMVVLDPAVTSQDIRQRATTFATTSSVARVAAAVFVRYDAARELFRRAGADLDALVQQAARDSAVTVPVAGATAQLATPVSESISRPPNVVAVLRGSDAALRNEYIVLSAHMDHIGIGRPNEHGDSINNGADDDASGTSAVLEVAEALAALPTAPARSVIFLTVSGEEKGLLGSRYFVENPVVPIHSMVANINLDMIGRNAPDTIVAIGQDYSSLGPLTQGIVASHPELRLTVSRDIWPQERFFFRSDHYSFARKEVPAIFFFAGVHEDYHRPSDHVEKIDTDKAARVARLAYYLALEIANRRDPPSWTAEGLAEIRTLTR